MRLGAKNVTVLYRRAREDMPAADEEVAEAEAEGVKFKFLVSPIRIKGSDGKATEVELQVMTQGEADGAGRRDVYKRQGQGFESLAACQNPLVSHETSGFCFFTRTARFRTCPYRGRL